MYIIPKPQKFIKIGGNFSIGEKVSIFSNEFCKKQAERFAKLLQDRNADVSFCSELPDAQIIFNNCEDNCEHMQDGYTIRVSDGTILVCTDSEVGVFYAVESLIQLLNLNIDGKMECENCYIVDYPTFNYRSVHLDSARHFLQKQTVLKVIDLMANIKLNVLHFHLTDDQGWRIEIDKYPLLTQIGSVRQGSEVVKNGKRYVDDVEHSGYYTKQDIRDIVEYAKSKYIEVVPEIDLPGHFVAALSAYPQYSCVGENISVRKKWGISKDLLCAGNDDSYTFVKDILDEVCELFPSKYFHLGGDEAPKDRWCNCKKCKEKLSSLNLSSFDALQQYMVNEFRKHLENKGKTVICWNDGVKQSTNNSVVSQVWAPKTTNEGKRQANNGRKTILSPFFVTYFDYPYALTPLKKTYNFKPLSGIKRSAKENILGVEGTHWAEYIDCENKLFFNMLPRINALAEMAWGTNNNYADFEKRCKEYYEVYKNKNLIYNATAFKHKLLIERALVVSTFFKRNANVELDKQLKGKKEINK